MSAGNMASIVSCTYVTTAVPTPTRRTTWPRGLRPTPPFIAHKVVVVTGGVFEHFATQHWGARGWYPIIAQLGTAPFASRIDYGGEEYAMISRSFGWDGMWLLPYILSGQDIWDPDIWECATFLRVLTLLLHLGIILILTLITDTKY